MRSVGPDTFCKIRPDSVCAATYCFNENICFNTFLDRNNTILAMNLYYNLNIYDYLCFFTHHFEKTTYF